MPRVMLSWDSLALCRVLATIILAWLAFFLYAGLLGIPAIVLVVLLLYRTNTVR